VDESIKCAMLRHKYELTYLKQTKFLVILDILDDIKCWYMYLNQRKADLYLFSVSYYDEIWHAAHKHV